MIEFEYNFKPPSEYYQHYTFYSIEICYDSVTFWIAVAKLNIVTTVLILFCQRTPLHIAVREGQEYTVKSLVKNGAKVNSQDEDGVSGID